MIRTEFFWGMTEEGCEQTISEYCMLGAWVVKFIGTTVNGFWIVFETVGDG